MPWTSISWRCSRVSAKPRSVRNSLSQPVGRRSSVVWLREASSRWAPYALRSNAWSPLADCLKREGGQEKRTRRSKGGGGGKWRQRGGRALGGWKRNGGIF